MPVIMDGFNTYVRRGDGTLEYVPPHTVKVAGRDLYLFDQATGILSASASPEDCSMIERETGVGPDSPSTVFMQGPLGEAIEFPGVKSICSLAPPAGQTFLLKLSGSRSLRRSPERRSFILKNAGDVVLYVRYGPGGVA